MEGDRKTLEGDRETMALGLKRKTTGARAATILLWPWQHGHGIKSG